MTKGNENQPCNAASLEYMVRAARGPYVWVSDGIVAHGNDVLAWRQPVDALLRKHRIVRVRRLEDALAYLNGYAVPCWRQCADSPQVMLKRGQV